MPAVMAKLITAFKAVQAVNDVFHCCSEDNALFCKSQRVTSIQITTRIRCATSICIKYNEEID